MKAAKNMCVKNIKFLRLPVLRSSLVLLTLVCVSVNAHAEFSKAKCQAVLTGNDIIQVNRSWDVTTRRCYISVHPRNVVDLKYRDYYFDNTGFFMVFNSLGEGDESKTTGARGFFIFPQIEEYPDYSFEPNNDVIVKMVSGHQFRISGKDFSVISLSDGYVAEKPLSPNNQGGLEIKLSKGYWLDSGFRLGGLKFDNPDNKAKIQSAKSGGLCTLANKTFLKYNDGEFTLKQTGSALTQTLQVNCPQLKF